MIHTAIFCLNSLFATVTLYVSADVLDDVKTEDVLSTSDLYRHSRKGILVAKFHVDFRTSISDTVLGTFHEMDETDCTFRCLGSPNCFSFNMAVNPDSNGFYLCELFSTDKYRATHKLHANESFNYYSPWFPCGSSPCLNDGDCIPLYNISSFKCICKKPFVGSRCQELRAKSCGEIKSHSSDPPDGTYIIDPDGEGGELPFAVYCDMRVMNGVGVTVVSHDSESRTLVKGFEARGSYVRNISYTGVTKISALVGLTQVSTSCQQFIRYECKGSLLLNNRYYDSRAPLPTGWWVSRDGSSMTYWGGMASGDYKCACGLSNTCAGSGQYCNCDKNDGVWREDSGLLTNKSHLPVIQLRFGDTGGAYEEGYHTLGKLKCFGLA